MSQLEVVVPSAKGGRDLALCLEQLARSREDLDVRVTVATGRPEEITARPPWLKVIASPGDDVFTLRALGVAAATAPIVALTEDHCQVNPEWCRSLIAAFDDPDVTLAKGPVANGASSNLSSWASYFSNFAFHLADWPAGPVCPAGGTGATSAWRREACSASDAAELHDDFLRGWKDRDVAFVPGARVTHWQTFGLRDMLHMQYHNARACGAMIENRPGLARSIAGSIRRAARAWGITVRHPDHRRRAWQALPLWGILSVIIGWGQWVGGRWGPSGSAHHIA